MKLIAVASGKGGVGKSTVSLGLARALAGRGRRVGLLDADIYGPDIPLMLGLKQTRELRRWDLGRNPRFGRIELDPVEVAGIKVMSVGFLLAEPQMFAMPAMLASFIGDQLVQNVRWGALDYLVIDLPPGTADLQQHIFGTMSLAGAIVVVGPPDAAHLDARKILSLLREADVPVLGAVENMRGLRCPHCGETLDVFPPVARNAPSSARWSCWYRCPWIRRSLGSTASRHSSTSSRRESRNDSHQGTDRWLRTCMR